MILGQDAKNIGVRHLVQKGLKGEAVVTAQFIEKCHAMPRA